VEKKVSEVEILEIPDDIGYWLLRADGGKYYDDFLVNNFIAISDNEITFNQILDYDKNSIAGITIDHYKELYRSEYPDWSNQQIAHAVRRTDEFCNGVEIGDLVLVPAKRSTHFLLGVVVSDLYEITEDEISSGEKVIYTEAPYLKRRKVFWIKEVSRSEISAKLYWILSAHQTIFNLKDQRDYINQLLSPIYIQNGVCHGSLKISKEKGLNSDEWYKLYSIIKKYSDSTEDEVVVKSNVQSPGIIEFLSMDYKSVIALTLVFSGLLFGDINLLGVKIKGIMPYYQAHKKENIEMKTMDKDLEIKEEDRRSKQLENEKAEFELMKEKEGWKKENEADLLREQLQISSFDAGKTIGHQRQMDNSDSPNADEL